MMSIEDDRKLNVDSSKSSKGKKMQHEKQRKNSKNELLHQHVELEVAGVSTEELVGLRLCQVLVMVVYQHPVGEAVVEQVLHPADLQAL